MIFGITGQKGSGKDTLGSFLVSEYGYSLTWFAEPLKEALRHGLRMSQEQLYGHQDVKEAIDPRYGVSPRHAMQTLGTEWGRKLIHPDVWVNSCMDKALSGGDWVIPDVRFRNEARAIQKHGGYVIEVIRETTYAEDSHASETSFNRFTPDMTVYNNGSVQDLMEWAKEVLPRHMNHVNPRRRTIHFVR